MSTPVFPGNAWEYIWRGTRRNAASGEVEAATGLTIEAWFSDEDGGATIDADLTKTLAERADTDGEYFAIVTGDVMEEHLADYDEGDVIYEVMSDGTDIIYSAPRTITRTRTA